MVALKVELYVTLLSALSHNHVEHHTAKEIAAMTCMQIDYFVDRLASLNLWHLSTLSFH